MIRRTLTTSLALGLLMALVPVPAQASAPVHVAHTNLHHAAGGHVARAAQPAAGSASPMGYIPCDLFNAYRLSQAPGNGAGVTIAVIDAFHLASATADYQAFDAKFSLGGGPALKQPVIDSVAGRPAGAPRIWADEIDLDIEWAHAVAPAAQIVLVEATNDQDPALLAAVNWAVGPGNADIVTMSWSIDENPLTGAPLTAADIAEHDTHFLPTNSLGKPVAYVAATGDAPGANSVGWPSDSTKVIAVGGSTLDPSAAGEGAGAHSDCFGAITPQGASSGNEHAWGPGSPSAVSGPSAIVDRPAFQNGLIADSHRIVPDVAMMANPGFATYSGPEFAINSNTPWENLVGTSGSAVVMAGILARLATNRAVVSQPGAFYGLSVPSSFNDVTSGQSGGSLGKPYSAGPGFDAATGLGSPKVAALFPSGLFKPPTGGPSRILDTRGPPYNVGPQGMLQPSTAYDLTLPTPPPGTNPSAVVLNVTATDAAQPGFVAAYGGDATWKGNSNLNFAPGQASTNLVTAPVAAGKVHFISSTAVDLVVDLFGWYSDSNVDPADTGARLNPMSPTRIIDSRPGQFNVGPYNTLWPCGPTGRQIQLPGSVPRTASAVVVNVTAVNASAGGFLGAFPRQPWPGNSNVNYSPGPAIPNRVIVPIDSATQTFWVNSSCPASVDVIIDLSGYYDPSAVAPATVAPPTRIYDSRLGAGMVTPGNPRRVLVGGAAPGVPIGIKAVALNVTVTDASTTGYFAAYPDGTAYPGNSDLSAIPGTTTTNLVIVPVGSGGYVDFAYGAPSGAANLIVDLVNWFG